MTAQLLIYETVVHLSAARHRDCAVEIGGNYGFSRKTNSVPLMAVEFPFAASEYAIVFAGTKEQFMPAVILGVRESENLYLSQDSKWDAKYIPAFVRRYPFVFSDSPDKQRLLLCIDEAFSGFNREGRGQKLFGADGKPTPYVEEILKFLQEFQAGYARTQAFCEKVRELDLLEPMQAQVEMASRRFRATSSPSWRKTTNWSCFISTCSRCAISRRCRAALRWFEGPARTGIASPHRPRRPKTRTPSRGRREPRRDSDG